MFFIPTKCLGCFHFGCLNCYTPLCQVNSGGAYWKSIPVQDTSDCVGVVRAVMISDEFWKTVRWSHCLLEATKASLGCQEGEAVRHKVETVTASSPAEGLTLKTLEAYYGKHPVNTVSNLSVSLSLGLVAMLMRFYEHHLSVWSCTERSSPCHRKGSDLDHRGWANLSALNPEVFVWRWQHVLDAGPYNLPEWLDTKLQTAWLWSVDIWPCQML